MRYYRNMSEQQKKAISQALRGRTMSDSHKEAISKAMKEYWSKIPYKQESEDENGI